MKDITEKEFILLRDYIKKTFGVNLNDQKKSLLFSRLRSVLQENGFDDFTTYYNFLINDKSGEALVTFIDKITTNHTFFMREIDHFFFFRDTVLPYIEKEFSSTRDLRLWCAGCSSGEEAYTLQMFIHDYFKDKWWDKQILATDISTNVLKKAIKGVYPNESIKPIPNEWKKSYFQKYDQDHSMIVDAIKKDIIFRRLNLMEEHFSFKAPFQVIFCRNVMIYFDNQVRETLLKKFYDLTIPGGFLFIGHSESLSHTNTKFKHVMPAVYRRV